MPIPNQAPTSSINTAATPAAGTFARATDKVTALSTSTQFGVILESDSGALQLKDSVSFAFMFAVVVVGLIAIRRITNRIRSGRFRNFE